MKKIIYILATILLISGIIQIQSKISKKEIKKEIKKQRKKLLKYAKKPAIKAIVTFSVKNDNKEPIYVTVDRELLGKFTKWDPVILGHKESKWFSAEKQNIAIRWAFARNPITGKIIHPTRANWYETDIIEFPVTFFIRNQEKYRPGRYDVRHGLFGVKLSTNLYAHYLKFIPKETVFLPRFDKIKDAIDIIVKALGNKEAEITKKSLKRLVEILETIVKYVSQEIVSTIALKYAIEAIKKGELAFTPQGEMMYKGILLKKLPGIPTIASPSN